jgi:hypothetical protein
MPTPPTLFTGVSRGLDKSLWFLEALICRGKIKQYFGCVKKLLACASHWLGSDVPKQAVTWQNNV